MTSDTFFAQCGEQRFDLIFVDSDETYARARRNLENGLEHLKVGGWLVLHHMFPSECREEDASQVSRLWTGEVWKLAFDLAQSHDVQFRLLKIDHGVGVVRKIRDNPKVPNNGSALSDQTFQFFSQNIDMLPLIDYEKGKVWIEYARDTKRVP